MFATSTVQGLEYEKKQLKHAVDVNIPALLVGPTGCLSGETEVYVNRGRKGQKKTLKHLYNLLNGNPDNLKSVSIGISKFDSSIPTLIRSFDGESVRLKQIKNVVYSGFKKTFTITLTDGRSVRATADHKFLTTDGWVAASDLTTSCEVLCDSPETKGTGKKSKKQTYLMKVNLWFHPFAPKVVTSKDPRGWTKRCEEHRLVAEAYLNGINYESYLKILRSDEAAAKRLKYIDPKTHAVHHKDGDPRNNVVENLEVLTYSEHNKIHGRYANFGQGKVTAVKVKSVDYFGEEDVYDVQEVEDTQNFSANGMIVHNCGKTTTIHSLANERSKKLVSIPLHGQIGREELIGKWLLKDGATYWQDGILSQAIKENSWVLFDEINAALPEVLFILHSLLDHQRRITLPEKDNEVLEAGPEFRFFATMNPTEDYVGTKTLNLAFMSRFGVVLHFDYLDYRAEALVIADVLGNSGIAVKTESCEAVSLIGAAIRELYKKKQVFYPCSTRDLIYAAALLHDGAEMDEAINSAIINKLSNEERVVVSQTITVVVKYLEDQKGVSMSIMTALKDADQLRREYDKLKIAVKNLQSLKNGLAEGIKQIDV